MHFSACQPQPDLVVLFLTIHLDSHLISGLEDLQLWQHHLVLDHTTAALAEVTRAWRLQVAGPEGLCKCFMQRLLRGARGLPCLLHTLILRRCQYIWRLCYLLDLLCVLLDFFNALAQLLC